MLCTRLRGTNFYVPLRPCPLRIKDATVRRREALRHRQFCWEALANGTDSLLALAWTTWIAVHKLKLATTNVRRLVQAEAASLRVQLFCELQEACERRDLSLMWPPARKLGGEETRPKKKRDFSMYRRRSDPAAQIGEVSCAAHVRMEDAKE